ncbi:hypothetical protein [Methylorubrum rhodinum]
MLAEHDLVSELAFANPNGHIPSSQFEISMPCQALSAQAGKLSSSCPDMFVRPTIQGRQWRTPKEMVETDGIEPTT